MQVERVTQVLEKLTVSANQQAEKAITVRLPKLEIPKFGGDIMKWTGFWEQFSTAVHNQTNVAKIDKFNYLVGQLSGIALKTIAGLPLTSENYQVAVDLLKERYGKNHLIIEAHYSVLSNISLTANDTFSLRLFYDTVERDLRSLVALGENVDNMLMVNMIKAKLPRDVLTEMEHRKDRHEPWIICVNC